MLSSYAAFTSTTGSPGRNPTSNGQEDQKSYWLESTKPWTMPTTTPKHKDVPASAANRTQTKHKCDTHKPTMVSMSATA